MIMERAQFRLQPECGPIHGDHYIRADPDSVLWGRLPCAADQPLTMVHPGESVTFDTVSHEGILPDQGSDPATFFASHGVTPDDVLTDSIQITRRGQRDHAHDGPHVVSRPIGVIGAEPGDLVSLTVLETLPRVPYGVVSNRHGRGALPGELPRGDATVSVFADVALRDQQLVGRMPLVDGGAPVVEFGLRPFLGIMGVTVPGNVRPHSVPPGVHGGNLDINLLTVDSTLHLPVLVPGAGVYVGDPHFAQGDGEVALTAMEASLRCTLKIDLLPRERALSLFGELAGPLAQTVDFLIPTGLDADLDEAVRACVRQAINLLRARYGMAEHLAYAYLSAATDFNISQVVDLVCGVHARIRLSDFVHARR